MRSVAAGVPIPEELAASKRRRRSVIGLGRRDPDGCARVWSRWPGRSHHEFVGFAHVWGWSMRGKGLVCQITAKDRFARAI